MKRDNCNNNSVKNKDVRDIKSREETTCETPGERGE